MNKEILESLLKEGKSSREIGLIVGLHKNTVLYWIKKYGLSESMKYSKNPNYKINKIDTKEKAYFLGFLAADGAVSEDKTIEVSVQMDDKEIVVFLASVINGTAHYDYTIDKKNRRFPRARTSKRIKDISTFIGGNKKEDRHFPIANDTLEKYVLQGFFDADGCITWGRRKDKNRIWQKISMTSSLKLLTGVQQFLLNKLKISTIVRPKKNSNCYIIEFSNKTDVLTFLDYIYSDDFVILKRKYQKANALRRELEENGEGAISNNTVPSPQRGKV